MNPTFVTLSGPLQGLSTLRRVFAAAVFTSLLGLPASAVTYQYYRFKPTSFATGGNQIQLSEFNFKNLGTPVSMATAVASSAGQGTGGGEDPPKVIDGSTATKWFRGDALTDGNELIINFGAPTTVDNYNLATANDNTTWGRTPSGWVLAGSNDGTNYTTIDIRPNGTITANSNFTFLGGANGYTILEQPAQSINAFGVLNTSTEGTSAIVVNGQSASLAWNTSFATEVQLTGPSVSSTVAAVGSQSVTPPDGLTSTYTLTATQPPLAAVTRTAQVRAVAGGSKTYRFVRYTGIKRRGGPASITQVSEFEFYNGSSAVPGNKVAVTTAFNPGGDSPANEGVANLVDGNFASKWLDFNSAPVVFDFGAAATFDRYLFVTGNDAEDRDAINWTLEGSNDETTWDLIENVNFDYPTPVARNASTREIPLPGASLLAQVGLFTGNATTLANGQPLTLTYKTTGASSVSITSGAAGGTLPSSFDLSGSFSVTPTATSTYTLTANSGVGLPVTATFTVTVIPNPGTGGIDYTNFAAAGAEILKTGAAAIDLPSNRLRLTPNLNGQLGSAWFINKLNVALGFQADFGLSLNKTPDGSPPADGVAFVIQNSAAGSNETGTGEAGLPQNALNIKFTTYGGGGNDSRVEVRDGTTVLASTVTATTPGVRLYGLPGQPNTLGSSDTDPAYQIKVVYVPGDLDVYLDGIAVIQNVSVDLQEIGAADAAGKSFFGFTARTGGFTQNNDITGWQVKLGNFASLPPFGMVKQMLRYNAGETKPASVDLVWNARSGSTYNVYGTTDFVTWGEPIVIEAGLDGQIGTNMIISTVLGDVSKAFFRVEEVTED
ncbi:MAG: discoidin domain-containing protein [Verrucomicrobiota bacterium]